jgi:hypothetical protein
VSGDAAILQQSGLAKQKAAGADRRGQLGPAGNAPDPLDHGRVVNLSPRTLTTWYDKDINRRTVIKRVVRQETQSGIGVHRIEGFGDSKRVETTLAVNPRGSERFIGTTEIKQLNIIEDQDADIAYMFSSNHELSFSICHDGQLLTPASLRNRLKHAPVQP